MSDVNIWTQVITGSVGLIGTFIGGYITYRSQITLQMAQAKKQQIYLSRAIAAEIEAYLDLMDIREHTKYAREIIKLNKSGSKILPKNWLSGFEKKSDPFPVLSANLPKIGLLGESVTDVIKFYSRVNAVRLTLMSVDDGNFDNATAQDVGKIMRDELEVWENAYKLGRSTIITLKT